MGQYYKISRSSLTAIADATRALVLVGWDMSPAQIAAQLAKVQVLHCGEATCAITTMVRPTSTAKVELMES